MTPEEAIKHLQSYAEVVDNMIKYCKDFEPKADITGYLEKKTVFAMAISALKEIQLYKDNKLCLVPEDVYSRQCSELDAYKEIGTVEECREALEKQIPKKAEIYTDTIQTMSASINRDVYLCPVCGEFICNVEDELPNYCSYCGQAINDEN